MAADELAAKRLIHVGARALADARGDRDYTQGDVFVAEIVVKALTTDDNFNDVIRVLGGKVAGLDQRMRPTYGSSVLFKQGADLYQWGNS